MPEINLLNEYPERKRDTGERAEFKTDEQIQIAKKFGWEYFDKKGVCYDGYVYDGRWMPVAKKFIDYYNLNGNGSVLDVGCAKGYLLYDFKQHLPSLRIAGVEISQYAIDCAPPEVKPFINKGSASDLSKFKDKEFDLVISINTVHNLKLEDCKKALKEIERVGKNSFITNDAWRNDKEKENMLKWNLTGETYMHVEDWEKLFQEVGYNGDYYWFIAE